MIYWFILNVFVLTLITKTERGGSFLSSIRCLSCVQTAVPEHIVVNVSDMKSSYVSAVRSQTLEKVLEVRAKMCVRPCVSLATEK